MQSRQTAGSRDRGIGRYSLSLARAMLEAGSNHEFLILANGALGAIEDVRQDFGLPSYSKELKVFSSLSGTGSDLPENSWRRKASELMRESYLNELGVDFVHTTSMFEGFNDASCSSAKSGICNFSQAVTLYDIIPYAFRDIYLDMPEARAWYYERLGHLRRSDLLLAISDFSARDAISRLGLTDAAVVNISGAADPHFMPMQFSVNDRDAILGRYGLTRFLMYTGGIDHRKNIDALIRAYACLPSELLQRNQLAIVCKVGAGERKRLAQLAHNLGLEPDRVVMTGFVPEDDLVALYNLCEAFVFPSWYEGFGLPALEAMQCGAAVIAANASSLPEVVGRKDALFNPFSEADMALHMRQVIENKSFRRELQDHGLVRSRLFTWQESARRAIEAIEEFHAASGARGGSGRLIQSSDKRPTLAFVSPFSPERSGIADYSRDLLPFLAKHYRITLVNIAGETDDPYLCANMPVRDVSWLRTHVEQFERVLYQFGNSTFHEHMFDLLDEVPGAVVLHDFWLSGIISHLDLSGTRPGFWNEELYASHGWRALHDRNVYGDSSAVEKYPTSGGVVDAATGVIVHSQRSRHLLNDWYGKPAWEKSRCIQHLRIVPGDVDKDAAVQRLGFGAGTRLLCTFGFIHQTKYSLEIAEAFLSSTLATERDVLLIMVGAIVEGEGNQFGDAVRSLVSRSNGKIILTGFADHGEYALYLQAAEAAVQLRRGSRGETSGAVLDCLAHRVPLLVNENAAFSEIPPNAVEVLPVEFGGEVLSAALERLMVPSADRTARIEAGIVYLREYCDPALVANSYRDAIELFEVDSKRLRTSRLCASVMSIDAGVAPTQVDLELTAKVIQKIMRPGMAAGRYFIDTAIADSFGGEALLSTIVAVDAVAPSGLDLISYQAGMLRNARSKMSLMLDLPEGLADQEIVLGMGATYLFDLSAMLASTGSIQALDTLVAKLDPINDSIWFLCTTEWLRRSEWPAFIAAAKVAAGFIVESESVRDEVAEALELALVIADKAQVDLRWPRETGLEGMLSLLGENARDGGAMVQRPSARAWHAAQPELLSEVGQLRDGVLSNSGASGFLIFGPYARIPAGQYCLRIYGQVSGNQRGGSWYDVVSGRGRHRVLDLVPIESERLGLLAEKILVLTDAVEDLEIRIWVAEHEEISFHAFALFDESR